MPEIVRSNPLNSPDDKPVKTHSSFKPNYTRFDSHRFGLNIPHFAMPAVADDDISMRCVADVDTMTLKAPLMVPVKRSMDYFQVPIRAILPHTAELLLTNPRTGEDIDPREVNSIIRRPNKDGESYVDPLGQILDNLANSIRNLDNSVTITETSLFFSSWVNGVFRLYQICRPLFLSSSLPKYLGYSLDKLIRIRLNIETSSGASFDTVDYTLTEFFELLFSTVNYYLSKTPTALINAAEYRLRVGNVSTSYPYGQPISEPTGKSIAVRGGQSRLSYYGGGDIVYAPLSYLLDKIVESANAYIVVANSDAVFGFEPGSVSFFSDAYKELTGNFITGINCYYSLPTKDININKCLAYQLVSSEFYTNDRVDGVYSSKLYQDNLKMLAVMSNVGISQLTFSVNGVSVEYDPASAHLLNLVLYRFTSVFLVTFSADPSGDYFRTASYLSMFMYLRNIFDFTRSLRFEDYFVGARVSPLAVGDVSVGVDTVDNTVDIIDVTKNIQVQRFLNQVNRVGRKFRDYIKGIFGDIPLKDCHEPLFLGHVSDTIGAEETDNTGAAQLTLPNSTTSKLRNNSARFGFEVHCSEPSILIGITNYDIPRAYGSAFDRDNFHVDRFDMFNPFLQFVGDQEVFSLELSPRIDSSTNPTFGYAGRYSEYKQRVDLAGGAFATKDALPGYAMVISDVDIPNNINSDFLRSHVTDLDEFYVSRTGLTDCYRFNFIVRCDNSVSAKRPMAFNPSIL